MKSLLIVFLVFGCLFASPISEPEDDTMQSTADRVKRGKGLIFIKFDFAIVLTH